jgi:hypothetical protein
LCAGLLRLSGYDKRREQRDDERDCSHSSIPKSVQVPAAAHVYRFRLAVAAHSLPRPWDIG